MVNFQISFNVIIIVIFLWCYLESPSNENGKYIHGTTKLDDRFTNLKQIYASRRIFFVNFGATNLLNFNLQSHFVFSFQLVPISIGESFSIFKKEFEEKKKRTSC